MGPVHQMHAKRRWGGGCIGLPGVCGGLCEEVPVRVCLVLCAVQQPQVRVRGCACMARVPTWHAAAALTWYCCCSSTTGPDSPLDRFTMLMHCPITCRAGAESAWRVHLCRWQSDLDLIRNFSLPLYCMRHSNVAIAGSD
jgi:hypothetical protein